MRFKKSQVLAALLVAGASSSAMPALAQDVPDSAPDRALGNHQKHVRFDLGVRSQFIKSAGFDPFSKRDALTQVTTSASWAFLTAQDLSVAALVGFDLGGTSANARSDRASLDVMRFTLAPEARYHVLRILAVTVKVGPTLTRQAAELSDGLDTSLSQVSWRFGVDATAGAAVELWGYASGRSHKPRLWLTAEGGYGWSSPMKLNLKPDDPSRAPERLAAPALGDLSLSGPIVRVAAALSFW